MAAVMCTDIPLKPPRITLPWTVLSLPITPAKPGVRALSLLRMAPTTLELAALSTGSVCGGRNVCDVLPHRAHNNSDGTGHKVHPKQTGSAGYLSALSCPYQFPLGNGPVYFGFVDGWLSGILCMDRNTLAEPYL